MIHNDIYNDSNIENERKYGEEAEKTRRGYIGYREMQDDKNSINH